MFLPSSRGSPECTSPQAVHRLWFEPWGCSQKGVWIAQLQVKEEALASTGFHLFIAKNMKKIHVFLIPSIPTAQLPPPAQADPTLPLSSLCQHL